jgi:hypothetical protein
MAAYEDSYKSQLQGVSQQVERERLEGQLSEQVNMLSDPVTNLRRRTGAGQVFSLAVGYQYQPNAFLAWDTVVGSVHCQVIADCHQGLVYVYDMAGALVYTSPVLPYLQTTANPLDLTQSDSSCIYSATVDGELFLANTKKKPVRGVASTYPVNTRGFVYVVAGVFSKTYRVDVTHGGGSFTASYTTPNGTSAGDAAVSTPEYIASQLQILIAAGGGVTSVASGATVAVTATTGSLTLKSGTGLSFIVASNNQQIRNEEDLPPNPPGILDGMVMTVGDNTVKRYYTYHVSTNEWLESGDKTSPLTMTNAPISLKNVAGTWSIDSSTFEGRLAGDDTSNPDPAFMEFGITGMASYQGRLVLLAGNTVCMSASNAPRRFYRSTVTSLLDSDCIGIASTATTAATYRHAVQFNRDLMLFSDRNQAMILGTAEALTPRTAAVLPISEYACDIRARPLQVGQGLLFSTPRSDLNYGMMEMTRSGSTDGLAQYVSNDVTRHLPTYLRGRCRFAVGSSVSNIAVFGSTEDFTVLYVHEYIWEGDKKIQQAWHRWKFEHEISNAYFSGSGVVLLFRATNQLVACKLEPQYARKSGTYTAPLLDMFTRVTVTDHHFTLPAWMADMVPADLNRQKLRLSVASGDMAGTAVGVEYEGGVFTTANSFESGEVYVGFPYVSSFEPSPPFRKDYKGVRVTTNKMTILRFIASTLKSGEFEVAVSDAVPDGTEDDEESPVFYNSPELSLDAPVEGGDSAVVIPARTRADSTSLVFSTGGVSELNLVGLEFVAQYHEKIKRAKGG